MTFWLLSGVAGACAVGCIVSDSIGARRGVYFCKPATLLCIVALAWLAEPAAPAYRFWIVSGLILSLIGDVLLMLPRDRFVAGLAAFLTAHWCYIAAFSPAWGDAGLVGLLPWLLAGGAVLALLRPPGVGMTIAVAAYTVSIVAMAWLAIERARTAGDAQASGATLAALGAVTFMASDILLGMHRFRGDWRYAQAWILGTYFPAQWLIAASLYL